jgi:enamine deaminase RidA (YjgF/YER057c/UK114 family)
MTIEAGAETAKRCAIMILAQVKHHLDGDWAKLGRLVKLGGFVQATPDFFDHPKVINGASEFMLSILGDHGKHARFALGVPSLPFGVAVEIDAIFSEA